MKKKVENNYCYLKVVWLLASALFLFVTNFRLSAKEILASWKFDGVGNFAEVSPATTSANGIIASDAEHFGSGDFMAGGLYRPDGMISAQTSLICKTTDGIISPNEYLDFTIKAEDGKSFRVEAIEFQLGGHKAESLFRTLRASAVDSVSGDLNTPAGFLFFEDVEIIYDDTTEAKAKYNPKDATADITLPRGDQSMRALARFKTRTTGDVYKNLTTYSFRIYPLPGHCSQSRASFFIIDDVIIYGVVE